MAVVAFPAAAVSPIPSYKQPSLLLSPTRLPNDSTRQSTDSSRLGNKLQMLACHAPFALRVVEKVVDSLIVAYRIQPAAHG